MAKNKEKEERTTKINYQIKARWVLVIHDGNKLGEMPIRVALKKAEELSLDLVEVSPNAKPPVCILVDYGKYQYRKSKKVKQQARQETKTIRFRPNTEDHDIETKSRSIRKFLENGKKVQILVKNKGRELAHKDRGFEIIEKVIEKVNDVGKLDAKPRINGQDISCRIDPI